MEDEVSRLSSLTRHLVALIHKEWPDVNQTKNSFDYQWQNLPHGRHNLENEQFRNEATENVCKFTALPLDWFKGKKVVDVGCGAGRYSWALCKLGAHVLSLDQSSMGIKVTKEACSEFSNHRVLKADLTVSLNIDEVFDLVWCAGVLHHTGDTYTAFKNIVPLVKPGGLMFIMLYGEPRRDTISDYEEINEYVYWRKMIRHLNYDEKLEAIVGAMKEGKLRGRGVEHIHGYFDALSPSINDLYSWEEICCWLKDEGFCDIERTQDNRNHFVIAKKQLVS